MTPGPKDNNLADLPALVSQLQELAEQIRCQVDSELARIEHARSQAASESARLEALLVKTKSAFLPSINISTSAASVESPHNIR